MLTSTATRGCQESRAYPLSAQNPLATTSKGEREKQVPRWLARPYTIVRSHYSSSPLPATWPPSCPLNELSKVLPRPLHILQMTASLSASTQTEITHRCPPLRSHTLRSHASQLWSVRDSTKKLPVAVYLDTSCLSPPLE